LGRVALRLAVFDGLVEAGHLPVHRGGGGQVPLARRAGSSLGRLRSSLKFEER
jgi:hypothetical protein